MAVKDQSGSRSTSNNSSDSYGGENNKDVEKNLLNNETHTGDNSVNTNEKEFHHLRALSNFQRLSYGVGHVLNDLTASMWFSYLLVYLHGVNDFENLLAGNLMLIGQVSDALFTPFVGFESDRTKGIKKIGKRKTWHLVGTLCVMASFPFLFMQCIKCRHAPSIAQFVYYAPFVVIFQFGWAATQISHLSFSSDITPYRHERVALQSIRNMFTVISNLSVFGILYLLFYLGGKITAPAEINDLDPYDPYNLTPADAPTFRNLALICVALGTVFNFIFHLGIKEKSESDDLRSHASDGSLPGENSLEKSTVFHSRMNWKDWLKEHQFYQVAVLYMATRLYINVGQVYLPMYLIETIKLDKQSIAILPLVSYSSSFFMSFLASFINKILGRKITYLIALALGAGSCIWMYFVPYQNAQIYGCVILMGAAGSLLLITSLSMTSDLISANTESGAFVFGAMSFTDKLSNGIAVLLIQYFHPCFHCCPACEPYYRNVQVFVPGGSLLIALFALLSLIPQNIGSRSRAVDVLKVMENPATATDDSQNSSLANSLQCSCGSFCAPPSICPSCGVLPAAIVNAALAHRADIHQSYETDSDNDSDDTNQNKERSPLLRANINTPTKDVKHTTEYGSLPRA